MIFDAYCKQRKKNKSHLDSMIILSQEHEPQHEKIYFQFDRFLEHFDLSIDFWNTFHNFKKLNRRNNIGIEVCFLHKSKRWLEYLNQEWICNCRFADQVQHFTLWTEKKKYFLYLSLFLSFFSWFITSSSLFPAIFTSTDCIMLP